jgi:hypothetical protein
MTTSSLYPTYLQGRSVEQWISNADSTTMTREVLQCLAKKDIEYPFEHGKLLITLWVVYQYTQSLQLICWRIRKPLRDFTMRSMVTYFNGSDRRRTEDGSTTL